MKQELPNMAKKLHDNKACTKCGAVTGTVKVKSQKMFEATKVEYHCSHCTP